MSSTLRMISSTEKEYFSRPKFLKSAPAVVEAEEAAAGRGAEELLASIYMLFNSSLTFV